MTKAEMQPARRMRSLKDWAEELGVVVKTLLREIERGKLRAYKIGGHWRVDEADFEAYLRQRRRG